jgi:hypothetical protein
VTAPSSRRAELVETRKQQDNAPAPAAQPAYKAVKPEKDRWWETVYKRGAVEVVRRLAA